MPPNVGQFMFELLHIGGLRVNLTLGIREGLPTIGQGTAYWHPGTQAIALVNPLCSFQSSSS
jgi:hypothetical protein